jgi:hypothetical protein
MSRMAAGNAGKAAAIHHLPYGAAYTADTGSRLRQVNDSKLMCLVVSVAPASFRGTSAAI